MGFGAFSSAVREKRFRNISLSIPENLLRLFLAFGIARERKISPKFPCIFFFFSGTPSGHGHPRLRVNDVRAKNFVLLRSERQGESLWAGTSARISARTSAGYPAQKLYV